MSMTATYSPDDNKLRLYSSTRLDKETFDRVKAHGFRWAPTQEVFVAPAWTPQREELLIELCGEIGDEDTSLVDRAEQRAERFEEYSEKRAADAEAAHKSVSQIADNIPLGQPILVGHHSERHARKDAERIENGMRKAVKNWETSEYWKRRAAGAIAHAKYKELPSVRARRIKGIEADKRKSERSIAEAEKFMAMWNKEGVELTKQRALDISNYDHISVRKEPGSTEWRSLYFMLEEDKLTPEQARDHANKAHQRTIEHNKRWINHYDNRLTYERAMLQESGGIATDKVKPEKGGACLCWVSNGWKEIIKVNRISVTVTDNWGNGGQDFFRNIEFDKLQGVMSKADWEACGKNPNHNIKRKEYVQPEKSEQDKQVDALKDQLKQGVKVVAAPQLYPTPPHIAERMVEVADIYSSHSILEPSAGTGNILRAIKSVGAHDVTAVELQPMLANVLQGLASKVVCSDFLTCNGDLGKFDRILMNPPFENGSDIKHIKHAMQFLNEGGVLVAICANGPRQNEQLQPLASLWEELPDGTFKQAGTMVNTVLLTIER